MVDIAQHAAKETSELQIGLDEAHLLIGDLVNLQVQGSDGVERYAVRLIGLSKGRSVLVTAPMADGKYLLMRENQSFIVRAFSGKSAYAFSTQLLKSVNTPYPYLHLSYPREVRSLVVRKGARADVKLICAITSIDDPLLLMAGVIENLSTGGAQIALRKPPGQKGQQLVIKFKVLINGFEALLKVDGVIRAINLSQSEDADASYQLGIQFVDLPVNDAIHLQAFLYHELLEKSLGA